MLTAAAHKSEDGQTADYQLIEKMTEKEKKTSFFISSLAGVLRCLFVLDLSHYHFYLIC
jgi:hypothetical protein